MRKEALLTVKSLLSVLLRERSLRGSSSQRDVVLHESGTWLMVLSTVEGFINDKDILGTITGRGVDVQKLQRHLTNTRAWIVRWQTLAQQGQLTEQDYQRYVQYTDMILTKTSGTLDDVLKQEPVYRSRPQDWLRNAAAGLLMTICGYTGLGMNAYAQDVALSVARPLPAVEQKDTKDMPKKDVEDVSKYLESIQEKANAVKVEEGKTYEFYNNSSADRLRKKQGIEALAYAQKAITVKPDFCDAYANRATAFRALANNVTGATQNALLKNALEDYFKAIKNANSMPKSDFVGNQFNELQSLYHKSIGSTYERLGDRTRAVEFYRKAQTFQDTEWIHSRLAALSVKE